MDLNGEDQIKIILEKEKLNNADMDIVNSCRYVFHCGDCCLFNINFTFLACRFNCRLFRKEEINGKEM